MKQICCRTGCQVLLGLFVCLGAFEISAQTMGQRSAGLSLTYSSGARQAAGSASLSGISVALSGFAADMGRMPTASEGLNALIVRPPGAKNWRGPYISTTNQRAPFADPWGSQYRLVQQPAGTRMLYSIHSNGPDRLPGTRDDLSVQF